MEQLKFSEEFKSTKFDFFSKEEIVKRYVLLEEENLRLVRENYKLRNLNITDEQLKLIMSEQMEELRNTIYGSSSERYKKPEKEKESTEPKAPSFPKIKKPSERYPGVTIREEVITGEAPNCGICGNKMKDSGLKEESEQLTVIPKKFEIKRILRTKYRCGCNSCMQTAAMPPRIIPGSSYSDEMIMDVALSKYCDLLPIERYVQMAARGGLIDLPPHSLIELTHGFADFVDSIYLKIKVELLKSRVLHADETPHKMLEGSEKKSWYLWGFSTKTESYFECRNTRSGDIASELLKKSLCEILLTDVYTGYGKSIRETNKVREVEKKPLIQSAYCNAHARRYFFKSHDHYKEAVFYLDQYHEIYKLNEACIEKSPEEVLVLREKMLNYFEKMKDRATQEILKFPKKNKFHNALAYFLGNYKGLTFFLKEPDVPIDNNQQERLLRSHVVGRKTWYGTHSERGAFTAAVIFTIVETCKLNKVNPREYTQFIVEQLHQGKTPLTPKEFKNKISN